MNLVSFLLCSHASVEDLSLWLFGSVSPCAGLHKDNVMIAYSWHRFAVLNHGLVVCGEDIKNVFSECLSETLR